MDEPLDSPQSEADTALSAHSTAVSAQSDSRSPLSQTILIGPDGLRPSWRFLLYLALREGVYLALGVAIYYVQQSALLELWVVMIAELASLVASVAPVFILGPLEERPFAAYGLPSRKAFGKLFWVGVVWGLLALSILMFALHGAGTFDLGHLAVHGTRILKFAAFWGLFFLLVGLAEEFYLRGYTLFTLTQVVGFWPAAFLLSVGFALIHIRNPGETPLGLVGAGLIGFFFCLTLRRTGDLWFAVGFHTSWDWGQSFLYSVPDSGGLATGRLLKSSLHGPAWLSGGSVGPEGSVLLIILIALLWVAFDRIYPQAKYPSAGLTTSSAPCT